MWGFLEGNRIKYLFFVFILALSHSSFFIMAYLLGQIVDFFSSYAAGQSLDLFFFLVILVGAVGVLSTLIRLSAKMACSVVGARTRQRVRQISMAKLMDLELTWHEKEGTGSKIQKVNRGSQYVYRFFSDFTNNRSVNILVGIFGSLGVFLFLGWNYVLFSAAYLLIFFSIEYYFSKKISYWVHELNKISEKVSGKVHESASNVLSVKSLGLRDVFEESTRKFEEEYYRIWYKMKKTGRIKSAVTNSFAAIGYAVFLVLVGFDFVAGAITIGSIFVFASYFNQLRNSLGYVSDMVDTYIEIKASIGRLMTILGEDVFDRESDDLKEVPENWKTISFRNVSFQYKDEPVLRDFSLTIHRGEKIGLVGRSGCGKSTITKLLLGLYRPTKGEILIDGVSLDTFKHSSVTSAITPVLQDSEMFDTTLAENITISTPRKNTRRLEEAIRISSLDEVITKLPKGLDTMLGEKGYKVSGGERQRIGVARAVYKDSSLLILDEATSHLDSKTEHAIQTHLEQDLTDKTLLLIAHRLSTLQNVDRIIVMDKGRAVEEGTFGELLKQKGIFAMLYRLQHKR